MDERTESTKLIETPMRFWTIEWIVNRNLDAPDDYDWEDDPDGRQHGLCYWKVGVYQPDPNFDELASDEADLLENSDDFYVESIEEVSLDTVIREIGVDGLNNILQDQYHNVSYRDGLLVYPPPSYDEFGACEYDFLPDRDEHPAQDGTSPNA